MENKMKVEVWSDVMCPFCYIGKRNYEKAYQQFADANNIELVWKSFQLDPTISEDPSDRMEVSEYLAQRKGISQERVEQMHEHVTKMAADAGLEFHLDKTIMANSFKAHRMIQIAKEKGFGDAAEENLFYANFTKGKDFGDVEVLRQIGKASGLTEEDVDLALSDQKYAGKVNEDINRAREIGVTGVPFFVFNNKYAVSGAQPSESFLQVLETSHAEWKSEMSNSKLFVSEGPSCTPDGECV